MKALRLVGYGDFKNNLRFEDVDIPQISANEVLVEVQSASLNPHDYKVVLGELKRIERLMLPAPTGSDFSGIIVKIGKNVDKFKIGDAVYGATDGALAEYCKVNESEISKKPVNLSFVEASSIPVAAMTTVQALNRIGGIEKGNELLIHAGSGGVGTLAIQYAKIKGAYVYTTTSTANTKWVKDLGADVVIDYRKENYLSICSDLDIVYDTLSGQYTFDAFKVIKKRGRIVSLLPAEINSIVAKEFKLPKLISLFFSIKPSRIKKLMARKNAKYEFVFMKPNGKDLEEITSLIEANKIIPVIEKIFDFEHTIDAFEHLSKGHTKGKISINFNKNGK